MSGWNRDMKKPGVAKSDSGTLRDDKFTSLVSHKRISQNPTSPAIPVSRVSVNYQEAVEFGAQKVAVTVTVECDQMETSINLAGEYAFFKAVELVRDGWSVLNAEAKT